MLERRTYDHGVAALVSPDLERLGVLVAFTERTGGVSEPPFATLNAGFTRDQPNRVRRNRARMCRALGVESFVRAWQVHGSGVSSVGPELASAGFDGPETAIPDTDALVTEHRGVALSILTADCVPVALVDVERGMVGAVHAGWRGLAAGIVPAALARFADPASVVSVIGPAIARHHYEVGPDVAAAVEGAAGGREVKELREGRTFLDLPGTITGMLEARGVEVLDRAEDCTACEADRFFSYRRDGETGRQALIVVRR